VSHSGNLREVVVKEVKRAILFAVLASAFVLFRVLVSRGDWVDLLFVPIVVATYFVGAVVAGAVFGALLPLRNNALGSAVAGSVAALAPFSLALVTATIAGAPYGYARWKYDREP
jgi:hypothetical protein